LILSLLVYFLIQRYPQLAFWKKKTDSSSSEYRKAELQSNRVTISKEDEKRTVTELEVAGETLSEMTGYHASEADGNVRCEAGGYARHEVPGEQVETKELPVE
jgi:hypothetical protein